MSSFHVRSSKTAVIYLAWLGLTCSPYCNDVRAQSKDDSTTSNASSDKSEYSKDFKKKLLEFVPPMYREPLIASQLITSITKVEPGEKIDPERKKAIDRINMSAVSSVEAEQHARMFEHSLRMQVFQQQGLATPGLRSSLANAANTAEIAALRSQMNLWKTQVESQQAKYETTREINKNRLENRLKSAQDAENRPSNASSGAPQNVLLDSMRDELLEYGLSLNDDPVRGEFLTKLKFEKGDIEQIQLTLDVSGEPVTFSALSGSGVTTRRPTAMQDPRLEALLKSIDAKFEEIKQASPDTKVYPFVSELNALLNKLDSACDEVIGTGKQCASQGTQRYLVWRQTRDYRQNLRGVVNRIELEGNADILQTSRGRFDLVKHGESTLAFAKYIVDAGCRFAPAKPGGESAYMRLHQQLLQLHAILSE